MKPDRSLWSFSLVSVPAFLVPFLFCLQNATAGNAGVTWTPSRIETTIGDGMGATNDRIIGFVARRDLLDVELRVSDKVSQFVRIEPAHFAKLTAGTTYQIRMHFKGAPGRGSGIYRGSVRVQAGTRTIPRALRVTVKVDHGSISIPSSTQLLSETSTEYLSSVTDHSLTFSRSTPELQQLAYGNVIVMGITDLTPNGMLRKVNGVRIVNDQMVIDTASATLTDAIQNGSIELSATPTPADVISAKASRQGVKLYEGASTQGERTAIQGFYVKIEDVVLFDRDGNPSTKNDQIRADGSVSFDQSFVFTLDVQDFKLKHLSFVNTNTETAELKIKSEVDLLSYQETYELARYRLSPVTIWVGWVPVIIQPVITVNVGVDGKVTAGIETGVTQQLTTKAGLEYDGAGWRPVSDLSIVFDYTPPSLTAGCEFKGLTGPQLNLLLYGVVGPYSDVNGYLKLKADQFATPWWQLFGGVQVGAGARVDVLDDEIVDYYDPLVIGYETLLAEATTPPDLYGIVSGTVRDAASGAPLADVNVNLLRGDQSFGLGTTDANGFYGIQALVGSGYSLEFSKVGYVGASSSDVSISPGETSIPDVMLQRDTAGGGVLQMTGSLTFGPDDRLEASAIDAKNGFAYFVAGTRPGQIIKVRLSPFEHVATLTLNDGQGGGYRSAVIDDVNGFLYVGVDTYDGHTDSIVKIRLSDFTHVDSLSSDWDGFQAALIDSAGGFAYFGSGTIVKVNLESFSVDGELPMVDGERSINTGVIDPADGYAYFCTYFDPVVVKIRLSDFSRVGSLKLNPDEGHPDACAIDTGNGFMYVGLNSPTPSVIKISLADFSVVGTLRLSGQFCDYGSLDALNGYAYFGGGGRGYVDKIRLSDFTLAGTATFGPDEDSPWTSVIDDSPGAGNVTMYVGCSTEPGVIVRVDTGERRP